MRLPPPPHISDIPHELVDRICAEVFGAEYVNKIGQPDQRGSEMRKEAKTWFNAFQVVNLIQSRRMLERAYQAGQADKAREIKRALNISL
jgi:hypothetical protein